MTRLIVLLTDNEYTALVKSAENDLRDLRAQARYLLIKALAAEIAQNIPAMDAPQPTAQMEAAHVYAAQ